MKTEDITDRGKTIAFAYLPNVDYRIASDRRRFIADLSKDIQDTNIGYAGFKTRKVLDDYLAKMVFDKEGIEDARSDFVLDNEQVLAAVRKAIIPSSRVIPGVPIHIFIFPTFSVFVGDNMSGTTGYTPWVNTTLAFINLRNRKWATALIRTISHEFCHAVCLRHHRYESLLDLLVFEGLAEHFREQVVGGEHAPWTQALNEIESRKVLAELKSDNLLASTNPEIYRTMFFGGKKCALWAGYAIGYHLVRYFLQLNPGLDWEKIIAITPQNIFNRSRFLR